MHLDTVQDIVRVAGGLVAVYNMTWSWRGPWSLAHGQAWPTSIYQSVAFMYCVVVTSFSVGRVTTMSPDPFSPWVMMNVSLIIVSMGLMTYGHHAAITLKFSRLYWLYDHLSVCLALAELNSIAPDEAEEIARQARRRVSKLKRSKK